MELPALTGGSHVAPAFNPSGIDPPAGNVEADRDERFGSDDVDGECCALLRRKRLVMPVTEARPMRRRKR